jgi:uncharacterized protein YdhG (YjbR/CyaY superfamily)
MAKADFKDVDEYIASRPKDVQATLTTVRRTIQKAVPEAEEFISYHMPAYKFHGRLLYFAAYKNHFSLFGATQGVYKTFEKELAGIEGGNKGTLQFPLRESVPTQLIADIAKYRAKENLEREKKKG